MIFKLIGLFLISVTGGLVGINASLRLKSRTEFLEKYKDKTTEDDMIGHFGLGFYSAFMVADEVQIDTLSYKEGAKPVHWASEGGTEYEMQEGNKTTVGTEITLYLNEDSLEFANEYRAREVLGIH